MLGKSPWRCWKDYSAYTILLGTAISSLHGYKMLLFMVQLNLTYTICTFLFVLGFFRLYIATVKV